MKRTSLKLGIIGLLSIFCLTACNDDEERFGVRGGVVFMVQEDAQAMPYFFLTFNEELQSAAISENGPIRTRVIYENYLETTDIYPGMNHGMSLGGLHTRTFNVTGQSVKGEAYQESITMKFTDTDKMGPIVVLGPDVTFTNSKFNVAMPAVTNANAYGLYMVPVNDDIEEEWFNAAYSAPTAAANDEVALEVNTPVNTYFDTWNIYVYTMSNDNGSNSVMQFKKIGQLVDAVYTSALPLP